LEHYVALDVSLKEVSVCILDEKGGVVFEGKSPADPSAVADVIRSNAPDVVRVGLETGATTPWLYHALTAAGLPVICMDARHANAALSMRPRKSDRSDARGLADILRMGWYREVRAKSIPAHERRALLATRHHLVTMRTELDAQLRGLLKTFGFVLGPGNTDVLVRKAEALSQGSNTRAMSLASFVLQFSIAGSIQTAPSKARLARSNPALAGPLPGVAQIR
jgi:transposase